MASSIGICHWPDIDDTYLLCELLVHRNYRNDIPDANWLVARFAKLYQDLPKHKRTPFLYDNGLTYTTYWGDNNVFFLAVSRSNIIAMLVVSLLHHLHLIIEQFFCQQRSRLQDNEPGEKVQNTDLLFTRDAILDNNALIYELLDECVDFGVVQITDYNILKEYIKMEINIGHSEHINSWYLSDSSDSASDIELSRRKDSIKNKKSAKSKLHTIKSTKNQAIRTNIEASAVDLLVNSSIVRTQVLPVSWRIKGIFYSKNEIYIDIIESCNFAYDLETATVKSDQILGVCMVRSYLSGMPICKLGLNEERLSQVEYDEEEGNQLQQAHEEAESADELDYPEGKSEELSQQKRKPVSDQKEKAEMATAGLANEAPGTLEQNPLAIQDIPKAKVRSKKKVPLTNVQFHLCVDLTTIYKNNLICFTPPDDKFQLFSFRVEQQCHKERSPLILIDPQYQIVKSQSKLQIMCTVATKFKKKLHCRKLVVRMPVPPGLFPLQNADKDSFRFRCELGEVRYRVDISEILWAIADLPGSKRTVRMIAEVDLCDVNFSLHSISRLFRGAFETEGNEEYEEEGSNAKKETENGNEDDEKVPLEREDDAALTELDKFYSVNGASSSLFSQLQHQARTSQYEVSVDFEIPMLTSSGLRVTYFRVDEETMKYTCFPWIRYLTQANEDGSGRYRFRLGKSNFSQK